MVADALSRKSHCHSLVESDFHLSRLLHLAILHHITVSCTLKSRIIELQKTDISIFRIKRKMKEQELKYFQVDED
jgi:uncharacterized membrane protein YciS (DUF1049 family)